MIRRKKPWALSAAAVLMGAFTFLYFGSWAQLHAVSAPEFEPAKSKAEEALKYQKDQETLFKKFSFSDSAGICYKDQPGGYANPLWWSGNMPTMVGDSESLQLHLHQNNGAPHTPLQPTTDEIAIAHVPKAARGADPDASAELIADDEFEELVDDAEILDDDDEHTR